MSAKVHLSWELRFTCRELSCDKALKRKMMAQNFCSILWIYLFVFIFWSCKTLLTKTISNFIHLSFHKLSNDIKVFEQPYKPSTNLLISLWLGFIYFVFEKGKRKAEAKAHRIANNLQFSELQILVLHFTTTRKIAMVKFLLDCGKNLFIYCDDFRQHVLVTGKTLNLLVNYGVTAILFIHVKHLLV